MKTSSALLILSIYIWKISADCNICNPTRNVQCTSYKSYRLCDPMSGIATGSEISCPTGTFCSTSSSSKICDIQIPECKCGYCNTNGFTCMTDTQFSFCLDPSTNMPSLTLNTCPSNTKCNSMATAPNNYCTTTGSSDCPTNTNTNPKCLLIGRFPVLNSDCKSYYLCQYFNATPIIYNCLGNTLFNPFLLKCVTNYVCLG